MVVEGVQSVVQKKGAGVGAGEGQIAHGKADGQIELLGGAAGEGQVGMGGGLARFFGQSLELAGEGDGIVFTPGEGGEVGPRLFIDGGGEPLPQEGVGGLQPLQSGGDGVELPTAEGQLLGESIPAGLQLGGVPQGGEPAPQAGGFIAGLREMGGDGGQLPAQKGGVPLRSGGGAEGEGAAGFRGGESGEELFRRFRSGFGQMVALLLL